MLPCFRMRRRNQNRAMRMAHDEFPGAAEQHMTQSGPAVCACDDEIHALLLREGANLVHRLTEQNGGLEVPAAEFCEPNKLLHLSLRLVARDLSIFREVVHGVTIGDEGRAEIDHVKEDNLGGEFVRPIASRSAVLPASSRKNPPAQEVCRGRALALCRAHSSQIVARRKPDKANAAPRAPPCCREIGVSDPCGHAWR